MNAPDAVRARRHAFWGDARFFLGIALIAVSVAGVWFVVSASRHTAPVYAAARTIVVGEVVGADDVRVVEVALGQVAGTYLGSDDLADGIVATRTIGRGELVPQAAVGPAGDARTTRVVVRSDVDVPASIEPGSIVEIWEAPLVERGVFDAPRILVPDATVVSVARDESMIGGGAAALELVIPRSDVSATLAAMSGGSSLSVVETTGAAR
ncbi:SAF domain-containing protein [Microbacterium sp. RU33B]|uniref:SAF domain-containing protein n=1 Tax=Microbacterium sp. RU33B TaxID=1907390 RepID=UPI000967117A|nr:SAF domain-containing protein [Microbacterium sp. RU33B]SIT89101.1 Chaperone for flagella basal body P-ring formation [Microbacterium sp. RU33B]